MNTNSNKKLDRMLSEAIGRTEPMFDFAKWQADHPDAIARYRQLTRDRSPADGVPEFWRTIMNPKLIKFAAAAVIVIVVPLCIYHFAGSVEMNTIAFAEITEAMKKVPWMHQVSRGFEAGVAGEGEQWFGFEAKIHAAKSPKGEVTFWDIKEHKTYYYNPEKRNITINQSENDFPMNIFSPVSLLESMQTMFEKMGAKIAVKETEYDSQKVQLQEISLSSNEQNSVLKLYIQPHSKLMLAAQVKGMDSKSNVIMDGEITFSYLQTGPKDIYDLGVPRDAEIISHVPKEDVLLILEKYQDCRRKATQKYIAVMTHTRSPLLDVINMVDVDYKKGREHRFERHFVFNTGDPVEKIWIKYKEQLGDSFESLVAWVQIHSNNTGFISVDIYDGQNHIATERDDKNKWSKIRKHYSLNFDSMPEDHMETLAWPLIGQAGRIIEDDYSRENDLICIECQQQGRVYSGEVCLPGRFLYYLDAEKNYICRRKLTEWCPDAPWQEDKNWLKGIDSKKIQNGSITVRDIIEVIQDANGCWYPKMIEEKQTGIRKDYQEAPLKITTTKKIYIQTNPEFPDGIFEFEIPEGPKMIDEKVNKDPSQK